MRKVEQFGRETVNQTIGRRVEYRYGLERN